MKVTIYTVTECKFSKEEIEYLKTNKLEYTEKSLENNKDNLQEMLSVSNNFAGTPVTQIQKDDGQTIVLKGFTKQEFDKALGIGEQSQAQTPDQPPPAQQPEPKPMASPQTPNEEVKVEPEVKPQEAQPAPVAEEPKPEVVSPQPSQVEEPPKQAEPAVPLTPAPQTPAPQTPVSTNDNKDSSLDAVLDNLKEQSSNNQNTENNAPSQNAAPSIPEFSAK